MALAWMMVLFSQATTVAATPPRTPAAALPPDLETAYNLALAAPPGLGAHAFLRLCSGIADPALKREWLEMSWRLGTSATAPVALYLFHGTEEATRSGSTAAASKLRMDRFSLASRVAAEMVRLDPQRAKAMFAAIPRPDMTVAGCEAILLPDVSPYYEALVTLASVSGDTAFAAEILGKVSALPEMEPALRALAAIPFTAAQYRAVLDALPAAFGKLNPNARSFRFYAPLVDAALPPVIAQAQKLGVPADKLVDAYRDFLSAQFHAPHCGDSGTRFQQIVQQTTWFGENIRGARPPISKDGMAEVPFEGEMPVIYYWQVTDSTRLRGDAQRLRQGSGAEWKEKVNEFLDHTDRWGAPTGDEELDVYHQKALIYQELLEALPAAELGGPVAGRIVQFLSTTGARERNLGEWYFRAQGLLDYARLRRPEWLPRLLEAYRGSGQIPLVLAALLSSAEPAAKPK